MGRRRRYRDNEGSPGEAIVGIIVLVLSGGAYQLYNEYNSNRPVFYTHILTGALSLVAVAVAIVFIISQWNKAKENKFQKLLDDLKAEGLEAEILDFIQRFKHDKGKKDEIWTYREDKFRIDRLGDLVSHLNEKGFDIDIEKLKDILARYIHIQEKNLTIGSLGVTQRTLDTLSGSDFEKLLERLYTARGYQVQMIGGTGDQGGDLIANKTGERILIQAKRYKGSVGNEAVQQAAAARPFYDCATSVVVTSGYFTREAIDLAKATNVLLIGKADLQKFLLEFLKESWS